MEIRVDMKGIMKFDFLKQYTELEYLQARVSDLDEVDSNLNDRQRIMKLKSFDGLPFTFSKLKKLHLYGFAISKELFESFPDSLAYLYMKDCIPLDKEQYDSGLGPGLLKFPTGLQSFKFESTNETRYKYPIISNTKDLISLQTVDIDTNDGKVLMPISTEPTRTIPESFLRSLPDTVQTFKLRSTLDGCEYDWNTLNFRPLKNTRTLILNFDFLMRRNSIIEKFNLSTIPSKLTYLKLHFAAKKYVGKLKAPELRELYLDLGDLAKEEICSCANRIIGELKNLTKLTLAVSERNFIKKRLDLRKFQFGQLTELALELMDIKLSLVFIVIPNELPITFTRFPLFFVENEPDIYESFFNQQSAGATGPVEHQVNIVVDNIEKLSPSVKNCQITASKGEWVRFAQLSMLEQFGSIIDKLQ
ncbi:unnamed protein product [Ambrosiozyma monospora]|uniref:Unnamed protein product n=1 Tax=Ambrosiozyma monospora TaxID=43982 RepID=A0A9W6Z140_AMBMO|nr:unnamed protein product [Ambrosiozyma monospora]